MRGSPEFLTCDLSENRPKSASPIAFAENPHLTRLHAEFQPVRALKTGTQARNNILTYNQLRFHDTALRWC
jgi:hypothetical protein